MHVYLHIPFCHRICPYCSFYKHTPGGTDQKAFIQALLTEARQAPQFSDMPAGQTATTLYLGGGTPSMLSANHLTTLITGLRGIPYLSHTSDICLEANPATFDLKKAKVFRQLGVTRVSLGIQSFTAKTLETLGREHSPEQAAESVSILRAADIPAVNIDLMFSIPGQTRADWQHDLETAVSLEPDHISAYNLTYEEDTAYFDKLTAGEYEDDPDLNADLFQAADTTLTAAGYDHYETSNYAKNGKESRHNKGYCLPKHWPAGLHPNASRY